MTFCIVYMCQMGSAIYMAGTPSGTLPDKIYQITWHVFEGINGRVKVITIDQINARSRENLTKTSLKNDT